MKFLVYDIEWDVDEEDEDEDLGLPETMQVPAEDLLLESETIDDIDQEELSERISDHISYLTGFCHCGFEYRLLSDEEGEKT
ncbi:MAG: hypothetical protein II038_06295 [Lachnospiraceae bacterium]|nr:hypothetical protein [Lachnospiraceae bacterium]